MTTPLPFSSSTVGDVADPHAGDADRLALARDDRLRGLELGLELERLLLEHRDPQPLLLDDVDGDRRARPRSAPATAMKSRRCLRIAVAISYRPPLPSVEQLLRPLGGRAARAASAALLRICLRRQSASRLRHVGRRRRCGAPAVCGGRRPTPGLRGSAAPGVSHGLFGLNGVFAESSMLRHRAEDRERRSGRPRPGGRRPSRLGTASGIFTVFAPPPASTRMYWPLASPERLSAGDPGEPVGRSPRTPRPTGSSGYWSAGSIGSTVSFDHGMTTSLKQLESARAWSRNGTVRCGELGQLAGSSGAGRRPGRAARAWRPAPAAGATNGVAASSVAGVERTPGSASRANARSGGKAAFRLANAGLRRARARRGSSLDRLPERLVLGRERAGDDAEVGDQVLERAARCGRARGRRGRGRGSRPVRSPRLGARAAPR